jgi:hypothetical protein
MEAITYSVKRNTVASWIPARRDDTFTSDDMIDAYLHGKKEAFATAQKLVFDKFVNNIEKSKAITVRLINTLKDKNFNPIDAYLRVNAFDYLHILVTVPDSEHIKDEFLDMYDVVSELENEIKDEYYNVFIYFCPVNEYFEEINVLSDGYFLKLSTHE